MSSRSSSRPSVRRDNSSSSLEGMERPLRPGATVERPPRVESIIDLYARKSLPPTPSRPSTPIKPSPSLLSFVSNLTASSASTKSAKSDEAFSTRLRKKGASKGTFRSKLPEQLRSGLDLGKLGMSSSSSPYTRVQLESIHPGTRVQTPPASSEPVFTEWKAPEFKPTRHRPQVMKAESDSQVSPNAFKKEWGEEYSSLLEVSPQSPDMEAMSLNTDSTFQPSPLTPPLVNWQKLGSTKPMESRIRDVLDQPAMPEIMETMETTSPGEKPLDRRLSVASGIGDLPQISEQSVQKMTQTPQRRPSSKYPAEGMRPESDFIDPDHVHHGFRKSVGTRLRRKSLQQGVTEAYKALLHGEPFFKPAHNEQIDCAPGVLQTQSHKGKPGKPEAPDSSLAIREHSAHDSTPNRIVSNDQDAKPRAGSPVAHHSFEISKARRTNLDLQTKSERSLGKKVLSALSKEKQKRNEYDERVEEMKKKIKYVLPERPKEGAEFWEVRCRNQSKFEAESRTQSILYEKV